MQSQTTRLTAFYLISVMAITLIAGSVGIVHHRLTEEPTSVYLQADYGN